MKKQPSMTEPMVIPSKPKVKPVPKRESPKPAPRRGDPWTVPGPKVNPTPKAATQEVMKTIKKKVESKATLDFVMSSMPSITAAAFFNKFDVSSEMTVKFTAMKAMKEMILN